MSEELYYIDWAQAEVPGIAQGCIIIHSYIKNFECAAASLFPRYEHDHRSFLLSFISLCHPPGYPWVPSKILANFPKPFDQL